MATILEKLQEKYPNATGINDARNIAEAVACINGTGGRGANAIADHVWPLYTLTYNANGGSGTIDPVIAAPIVEITLNDGSDLTPPAGKEAFIGWSYDDTDVEIIEGPIKIEEDTTVYAIWGDIYTISFNANGGSGTITAIEANDGASIALPDGSDLTAPTDKEFAGWGASALTTEAVDDPYTVTADATLYAIWADESIVEP